MDGTDAAAEPQRFHLGDVSPTPSDEIVAAIHAAIDAAWPEPSVPDTWRSRAVDDHWRFSQRPWLGRQIPLRNWGRT